MEVIPVEQDNHVPCPHCLISPENMKYLNDMTQTKVWENFHYGPGQSLSAPISHCCCCHHHETVLHNCKHQSVYVSRIIRDELKRFCENTTIRGLPRIVRAQNRNLKLLWSVLVCILVLGCFTCMFFLARQYLEYNVIHPPRVLRHTLSPFPSVTMCNLRPLSPEGLAYLHSKNMKTPRQFALDLATYMNYIFYKNNKTDEYNAASAAFSLAGFLESIPNNQERRKLGYQHNKLIIKCQMTYLDGSNPKAVRCDQKGRWRKIIHAQYLNCATFEPLAELRANTTSIEMYIYLDELIDRAMCPDCFHGEVKSQLSGALIVIHGSDRLPNINDKSINLKPGSLTEIRLSIVENIQKMPPYGRCSLNHPETLHLHDMIYEYSEHACREATIQKDINKKCGCYSMEYPYNEGAGFEPCTRLNRFVDISTCNSTDLRNYLKSSNTSTLISECIDELKNFTERMKCKRSVTENYVHGALPSCTMPCSFYSYETEQSTSTWPTKTWQLTWLNSSYNRRMGFFEGPEFEPYRKAQHLLRLGNETEASQILDKINLLERNLLAVLINRPNFDVRKVEEKEVLSLTSLLSQTGGLFSIWIGLSMVSLGEIVEMCIRCLMRTRKDDKLDRESKDKQNDFKLSCECQCKSNPRKSNKVLPAYDTQLLQTILNTYMNELQNQNTTRSIDHSTEDRIHDCVQDSNDGDVDTHSKSSSDKSPSSEQLLKYNLPSSCELTISPEANLSQNKISRVNKSKKHLSSNLHV